VINFNDPEGLGTEGSIGGSVEFPQGFPGAADDDLVTLGNVTVSIAEEGDYIFGFRSDDGGALTLEGADFTLVRGDPNIAMVTDDGQTLEFNANTGDTNTFGTTHLTPGEYELEFITWERGGGASAEVLVGLGSDPNSLEFLSSLRLLGSPGGPIDLVVPAGLQLAGEGVAPIDGDYNGNGRVEQADLDLVLLNWGDPAEGLPAEWVNQRPTGGQVDQAELDGVLLNWGNVAASAVPEPSTLAMVVIGIAAGLLAARRGRRVN
jgi:hypothetical protein